MKHVIIIPTYNEADNAPIMIEKIFSLHPEVDILIVDDNSPDKTYEIVEGLQSRFKNLKLLKRADKQGLGKAYIHAFKEVLKDPQYTHLVMMDADMSHNPKYLAEVFRLSSEHDLVVASRYIKGGATVGWELWRRALSYFGNLYSKIITGLSIKDLTGGFNCIKLDALRKVDLDDMDRSGYAFQIELKFLLVSIGSKFVETPIVFANRNLGESKISNHIISEGIIAPWKMVFKIK